MTRVHVIVAGDWPNLAHGIQETFPDRYILNEVVLRFIREDALARFGNGIELCVEAAMFRMTQLENVDTEHDRRLQNQGWEVIKKMNPPPPLELMAATQRLEDVLSLPEHRLFSDLLELKVYDPAAREPLKQMVETVLALPDGESDYKLQKTLRKLRPERRQLGKRQVRIEARSHLIEALTQKYSRSSLIVLQAAIEAVYASDTGLLTMQPGLQSGRYSETIRLGNRLLEDAKKALKQSHVATDIDTLLSVWVAEKILQYRELDELCLVYLIGNDMRNYLVVAERMKRYGVATIFIGFGSKFDQMHPELQKKMHAAGAVVALEGIPGVLAERPAAS